MKDGTIVDQWYGRTREAGDSRCSEMLGLRWMFLTLEQWRQGTMFEDSKEGQAPGSFHKDGRSSNRIGGNGDNER